MSRALNLEALQERQQGMAGVHWLEAAQQVSAVRLLAQIEHHQLRANLQQQHMRVL